VAVSLNRILEARGATRVRIAPDGTWLGYASDLTGTVQLWRVPIDGGMPMRLTFDTDRVGAYRISPDGTRIAYGADVGGNERWQLHVMNADGTAVLRLTEQDDRMHHLRGWTADGRAILALANVRDARFFDLWSYPVDGSPPRLLYQYDGVSSDAVALPDGGVVLAVTRGRYDRTHLILVAPDGGSRQLTPDEPAALHAVAGAVKGGLVVRSDRERDQVGLAAIGFDGSFRWTVAAQREVEDADSDGRFDAYALNRDGYSELHVREGDRDATIAGLPDGCLATDLIGDSVAVRDGTVAVAWARYDAPSSIFVARPGKPAREIVPPALGGLAPNELPDTRLVSWKTFDGRMIPGFLLTPRGAQAGPRPTVIQVHGGPEGQARPLWNPLTVALVSRGFNVLQPNVRGSSGYGHAYKSLDDVRLRMDSVRDLDAGAAWLAESGTAPTDRIGVIGGSYGGFMTLAAIAFFPERRWAAAVDIVGIGSWRTFLERTDTWRRPLREAEYGTLEKDAEFLESISPFTRIDAIRAPLMVIHGANDPRVPVYEAEQMVSALRARGRDVEYLRYEDEGHGLAKAKNRADAWPKVVAFFERHLKD
jgi:dipeptidyl aminopeptidase/acylaminoacyl peptidase